MKLHNNTLVFWEVNSGKAIKTLSVPKWAALEAPQNLASLYFAPDSKTLIALTWKPQVIIWGWKAGTVRRIALPPRRIGADSTFHCCVSADGKYLAAGGGAGELLCVYELAAGREAYRLRCNAATSTFSPDGKRLVVSSMYNNKGVLEAVVRVFTLATGKEVAQYPLGHDRSYLTLSFSENGKTLACTFSDRSCLLDCDTGRVLRRLPGRPIVAAFSPDGKTLVANMGRRFRLWDVATGKVLQDRPGDFGSDTLRALAVLEHTGANGRRLLKELAGGSQDAWLTHQARAVLSRLARRCYRWLGKQRKGFEKAAPKQLFRRFVETGGVVEVEDDRVLVTLDRRSHTPILRETALDRGVFAIPWLQGRPSFFAYA